VAIADLRKGQPANFVGMHLGTHLGAEGIRFQHTAFNDAESAGAGPSHALQKTSAVYSVIIMVMLNQSTDIRIRQIPFSHSFLRSRDVVRCHIDRRRRRKPS
jgi:hypothetical protein